MNNNASRPKPKANAKPKAPKKKSGPSLGVKIILFFISLLLTVIILGAASAFVVYKWAAHDLPDFKKIADYRPALVTTVFARDGRVLGYLYREKRFMVSLNQLPKHVVQSFLAAEDADFFHHEGIDPAAIFRAFLKNFQAGGIKQGGSTVTQQVIKSLVLTPEKSYKRKIREAILAYRLEKHLKKEEILYIYMNQIYMGSGAYGVEAAARTYFGVEAKKLSIAQAAMLAGLPKAPAKYSPFHDLQSAKNRQKYVLERLHELNWIREDEYRKALDEKLVFKSMPDPSWGVGAYYLEEVRRRLIEKFGEDTVYTAGLNILTAVDLTHQQAAEKAMRDGLAEFTRRKGYEGPLQILEQSKIKEFIASESNNYTNPKSGDWVKGVVTKSGESEATVKFGKYTGRIDSKNVSWVKAVRFKREETPETSKLKGVARIVRPGDVIWVSLLSAPKDESSVCELALEQEPKVEGALVSIEPQSGDVVALVGGYSFARSQFNRATQAERQPGSSFKPIVYSAAMDYGYTIASVVQDAPFTYVDPWTQKVWQPENYEGGHQGPLPLITALARSRNLVTVRIAESIGIDKVVQRAKDMGLKGNFQPVLAISLGAVAVTPLNLTQAYTAFARDGSYAKARIIIKVQDAFGEVLFDEKPEFVPAMSPQTAFIMQRMLKEVCISGTGAKARVLGRVGLAGKTGTTNEEKDTWFMGFTPYLTTGVYVGYDQAQPLGKGETGGNTALPIWLKYRMAIEDKYEDLDYQEPEGIVWSGGEAGSGVGLPFKVGTVPTATYDEENSTDSGVDLLKQME